MRRRGRLALLRVEIAAFHLGAACAVCPVTVSSVAVMTHRLLATTHPVQAALLVSVALILPHMLRFVKQTCGAPRGYRGTPPYGARTFLPANELWRGDHPATHR